MQNVTLAMQLIINSIWKVNELGPLLATGVGVRCSQGTVPALVQLSSRQASWWLDDKLELHVLPESAQGSGAGSGAGREGTSGTILWGEDFTLPRMTRSSLGEWETREISGRS